MTHYFFRKYGVVRIGRRTPFLLSLLLSTIALLCYHQSFLAQSDNPQEPPTASPYSLYLPLVHTKANGAPDVPALPEAPLEWDSRLTARGARLIKAQVAPGVGYWRLISARWYNEAEAQGRHHIFIDLLDQSNQRVSNVPILVRWRDDETRVTTERKAGEPYATDFAMFAVAPAYAAQPVTNAPADRVEGMGLGSIEAPFHTIHTSYGLVWQWAIAASAPSPTATATITMTLTPTATVEDDAAPIPSVTPTPTLIMTTPITATSTPPPPPSTPSPTPSATPTATPTAPTMTPSPTATASSLAQGVVVGCQPDDRGSRFEGYVYVNGQPADGYRVVFSYEADGPWVTQPALSGSGKPGFYAHIISVGVPRVGNWYAWLIDQNQRRSSTLAAFTTDGANGACNVVSVNFLIQK